MDVIIIGAGAAALMAAKQLSEAGLKVCVLEARDRIGGRIHSFYENDSDHPLEAGAEFIHGNLEVTLQLLQEAGLEKKELQGGVWQVVNGKWIQESDFFQHADLVIEKLKEIEEDISIKEFIDRYFAAPEYEGVRTSLTSYVEGYYSGEISKTSSKSFLDESMSEDEQQYRPTGGYGKLMNYLMQACKESGAIIELSTVVKEIKWSERRVEVIDETGRSYTATRAIITVPLGVWTAEEDAKGAIRYIPALDEKIRAAKQMGFGSVIKILLLFNEAFWEDDEMEQRINCNTSDFHMAISDDVVPTWWTQLPDRRRLLTGWLSGPEAHKLKNVDEAEILKEALASLANIFQHDIETLQQKLRHWYIFNWTNDPFTRGSYSYSTLHTAQARKIMLAPVEDTLFFAGEALYEGTEMGTVEAALTSGMQVANRIVMGE